MGEFFSPTSGPETVKRGDSGPADAPGNTPQTAIPAGSVQGPRQVAVAPTPGPWEVDENASHDGGFIVTGYVEGTHIVICDRSEFGHRAEMSRANARLIAAAPELLEALIAGAHYLDALRRHQDAGVRGQMIEGTEELERLIFDFHDRARAAIAKAEGRS